MNKTKENPEKIVGDIINYLSDLHRDLVSSTVKIGQEIEKYKKLQQCWRKIDIAEHEDPYMNIVIKSSINLLSTARDNITFRKKKTEQICDLIEGICRSSNLISASTGSTASLFNLDFIFNQPTFHTDEGFINTSRYLEEWDSSLADTYKSIPEMLYGTTSDPIRSALNMIRQTFDHLFSILSPDIKVRKSSYWKKKKGNDPERIYRLERIKYAINEHVDNEYDRSILFASSKHMLVIYKQLNSLHKRGQLNEKQTRHALTEMQKLIEEWVNKLGSANFVPEDSV